MNFFERQQVARRNSRIMVTLFAIAVIGIVIGVDIVASVVWMTQAEQAIQPRPGQDFIQAAFAAVPWWVHVAGSLGTIAAIAGVSLYESAKLRHGGGVAVALMMGAKPVSSRSADPLERRLLNVVEEMAIASGSRVPKVFVMDEDGINAFAAGYDSSNTVVAVTRGALQALNRDELQAVIGHEFSHIVNGDMAMSVRMVGVLAGIVFIGAVGGFLLRTFGRGRSKKGSGPIVLLGLGLFVVGYVGLFFARLIKAAVSRQREFLADAASVQFTRNPDGLAGALDQIRATPHGALIGHRHAEDVSHLFFGQAISIGLAGLFATHPPIDERIRRIQPRFAMAHYRERRPRALDEASAAPAGAAGFAGAAAEGPPRGEREGDRAQPWTRSPGESMELVGTLDARDAEAARRVLDAIPAAIRERVRDPDGAGATLIALLLAPRDEVMQQQLQAIRAAGAPALAEGAVAARSEIATLGPAWYLPIVDLALPALKEALDLQRRRLMDALHATIHADRRVSMFEFILATLVRSQLFPAAPMTRPKYSSLQQVREEVVFALSLLANAGAVRGAESEAAVAAAFAAGAKQLELADAKPLARLAISLEQAESVLQKLAAVAPLPKARLVKALFAVVTADGTIRVIEAAMMRMMGGVLECPLPPLLQGMDPRALAA